MMPATYPLNPNVPEPYNCDECQAPAVTEFVHMAPERNFVNYYCGEHADAYNIEEIKRGVEDYSPEQARRLGDERRLNCRESFCEGCIFCQGLIVVESEDA